MLNYAIEHASIRCRNMEVSIEYYQRMFGAKVLLRRIPPGPKRITFLQIGDTLLELMDFGPAAEPVDSREHFGVHHVGIKTDDFESAYRDLKAKGAEFLGEPFEPTPGIRLAFLRDPNGAVIELAMRDPAVILEAARQGTVNW
jgi:catechol 2,3-dioxygenase-like lactoylglutathione lyase family enzyme